MILCANPAAPSTSPARPRSTRRSRACWNRAGTFSASEVAAFEQEFAALRRGGSRHRRRERHRSAPPRAAGAAASAPGDEVITVAHTAVATVAAIELAGGIPVLVDIDPELYTLDPVGLEARDHAAGPGRSCRSTSTARPRIWNRSCRSRAGTVCA